MAYFQQRARSRPAYAIFYSLETASALRSEPASCKTSFAEVKDGFYFYSNAFTKEIDQRCGPSKVFVVSDNYDAKAIPVVKKHIAKAAV